MDGDQSGVIASLTSIHENDLKQLQQKHKNALKGFESKLLTVPITPKW